MLYDAYTDDQLYEKYGYLMDTQHEKDIELLVDILKDTGLNVIRMGRLFILHD